MSRTRIGVAIAINAFIAIMEPAAWSMMLFSRDASMLAATGLNSLKFFTVLSNLLLGVASIVYAAFLVRRLRTGADVAPWAHLLKYVATVSVTVTLMTVLLFLGPVAGYGRMFIGANFWFHLVLPVLAIAEFVLLDTTRALPFSASFIGVVPTLLYGIGYCGNILLNGVGAPPHSNDWYGFTMWGIEYMPVVLAVMLLATWLIALALRALNARAPREHTV